MDKKNENAQQADHQDGGMDDKVLEMLSFIVEAGTAMSCGIIGMEQKLARPSEVVMLKNGGQEGITLLQIAQQFERFVIEEVGINIERHVIDASELGVKH